MNRCMSTEAKQRADGLQPAGRAHTGQTHQKVERLALRAVAPRRAARRDGLEGAFGPILPPARRGLIWSQRDQIHHPVSLALRILMRLPYRNLPVPNRRQLQLLALV